VNLKPKLLIIKDCARGIVLLKLTTDRREASRGLSATAELFFVECAMHYDVALV